MVGSFSYWVLFVASIHHAQVFLNTAQRHPLGHRLLKAGAWLWYLLVPLCAWLQPSWLRTLLLTGGSVHAACMMGLAWRSWRLNPSTQLALFVSMWGVYVTSAVVYWLYRVLEWPLLVTLGVQFVQGALMASLMGWSACVQVIQQRMNLQHSVRIGQARHRWYAAAQHDLWQPLQSIQLYAKVLLKAPPEKRSGLVSAMQLASQSVDDLMHHLRYWADEVKPHKPSDLAQKTMPVEHLLMPLIHEFQPLARMRHVVLRHPTHRAEVTVNVQAVQRMVRNLLTNALQYTPAGGRVLLGCRRQGAMLWVLCIDNGSGMNSQAAQDCFNAFTRLAPDDDGVHHLGLGLFSVKLLAQENQMPTRLTSVEGRGTVVGFGMRLA
jgi:signal transduction histidine kinase